MKLNIEAAKASLTRLPFPADVIIEVTARCNLICPMCPQATMKRPRGEMTMKIYRKIINEAAEHGSGVWLAIMGEPLLVQNIFYMILYARHKGITSVNLNTNAVLLNKKLAHFILAAGVTSVIIGLDALNKETYDKIRVGGDFDKVVANTKSLIACAKATETKVVVQFIVMDENEKEMEAFKAYWLKEGAIVKVRPKLGWGHGVETNMLNLTAADRTFPCPWLARTVSIHWNGNFAQCDGDYEGTYSPGNVNRTSIQDMWNGELARRRERHWKGDFDFEPCKNCKDWQAGRSSFFYPEGTSGHN